MEIFHMTQVNSMLKLLLKKGLPSNMPKTWSEDTTSKYALQMILARAYVVITSIFLTGCEYYPSVNVHCKGCEYKLADVTFEEEQKKTTATAKDDPWWGPWDPR